MNKLLVFAGTTEGRQLCEQLCSLEISITVCVATEYGKEMLSHIKNIEVIVNRLDTAQMQQLIENGGFDIVIDATHPYANEVTKNIKAACEATNTCSIRLLRQDIECESTADIKLVADIDKAVCYLNSTTGNVFITTGSKELHHFCELESFKERAYARVLPVAEVLEHCKAIGFADGHVIGMQGPFCEEINFAMLKQYNCKFLVTKNTGMAGGLDEKVSAAQKLGITVVLIDRPTVEQGYSIEQTIQLVCEKYGVWQKAQEIPTALGKKEYFPFFLPSSNKRVLFVGGGRISSRRISAMLKFNFQITVLSPTVCEEVKGFSQQGSIIHIKKTFDERDIAGYDYIIAATNSNELNNQVSVLAKNAGIAVNNASKKEECDFYFPGIVVENDAVIGVSCDGKSHHKTKEICACIRAQC